MSYQENFEAMTFDYDFRQLERPLHQCSRAYVTHLPSMIVVVIVQNEGRPDMDVMTFQAVSYAEARLAARKLQGMIAAAKALAKGSA